MVNALLVTHVLLTTMGYVGLIATNVYVLFLARRRDPQITRAGLTAWRQSSRIFGPCMLVGVFLGFGLAATLHVSLSSFWLVSTYILIVAGIVVQVAVMIPWQLRADPILEAGAAPRTTTVAIVMIVMSLFYTAILGLMLVHPSS